LGKNNDALQKSRQNFLPAFMSKMFRVGPAPLFFSGGGGPHDCYFLKLFIWNMKSHSTELICLMQ